MVNLFSHLYVAGCMIKIFPKFSICAVMVTFHVICPSCILWIREFFVPLSYHCFHLASSFSFTTPPKKTHAYATALQLGIYSIYLFRLPQLSVERINPQLIKAEYAVRGAIPLRAGQIAEVLLSSFTLTLL